MRRRNLHQAQLWLALCLVLNPAYAVTLQDFTPRADGRLTPECRDVYQSTISGCSSSDFTNSAPCSSSCIDGVVSLNTRVIQACAGDARNNQNIVAAFLAGDGIHDLCPNVVVHTLAPSASQASYVPGNVPTVTPSYNSNPMTPPSSQPVVPRPSLQVGSFSKSPTPPATYAYPSTTSTMSNPPETTLSTSISSSQSSASTSPSQPNPIMFTGPSPASTGTGLPGKQSCGSPFNWCDSSGAMASYTSLPSWPTYLGPWVLLICINKFNA